MKEGLLWHDDSSHDLAEKIERAAKKHEQKYGTRPNVCYVHPSALSDDGKVKTVGRVRVSSLRTVPRNYFWIGMEEKRKPSQGRLL